MQPTYELTNKKGYDFYESLSLNEVKLGGLGKVSKDTINSKVKTPVFACELTIDNLVVPENQFIPTSDFPASYRDLSFSLTDLDKVGMLTELIDDTTNGNDLLIESFIFDFFQNKKLNLLKLGFRFKFQAKDRSLTDDDIDKVIQKIIANSLDIDGIAIEGL